MMRTFFESLLLISLSILVSIVSLAQENKYVAQKIPLRKEFQDFLNSKQRVFLNLDRCKLEILQPKSIIGKEFNEIDIDPLFLLNPVDCLQWRDSLLITDQDQNCIFVADKYGKLIRRVGVKGKGPGDFDMPTFIKKNSKYLFVIELGNRRVQIMNHNFKYIKSVLYPMASGNICVGERYFTITTGLSLSDYAYCVYQADRPFNKVREILPQALPREKGWRGNNYYHISSNQEVMIIGTKLLPFLFIFDHEGNHLSTIEFTGVKASHVEDNLKIEFDEKVITYKSSFSNGSLVFSNGDILLNVQPDIFHLKREGKDYQKYSIKCCYRLEKPTRQQKIKNEVFKYAYILIQLEHDIFYTIQDDKIIQYQLR
ncbi:MAG: 6-bladed beta-propeller [bacterium]